jgi:leader peptidase (prepilin peptidase)/N-methyltransferase
VSFQTFLTLWVGACGLVVGSFLNVVIHRLPRGQSTVFPASRCPFCALPLRPWHNIPLLSFAFLRGRCARCKSPIAWRYPLVEALTGLLFVLCFLRFGFTVPALVAVVFCAVMVALAGIDLDHLILPDRITLPGIAVGLLLHLGLPWLHPGFHAEALPWATPWEAVLGALVGGALPLLLSGGWYLLRGVQGMGMGDAKMLALVGAFLGWKGAILTLVLAAFAALAAVVLLLPVRAFRLRHKLPFGPFLALGAVVALLAGREIVAWYEGLLWGFPGLGG